MSAIALCKGYCRCEIHIIDVIHSIPKSVSLLHSWSMELSLGAVVGSDYIWFFNLTHPTNIYPVEFRNIDSFVWRFIVNIPEGGAVPQWFDNDSQVFTIFPGTQGKKRRTPPKCWTLPPELLYDLHRKRMSHFSSFISKRLSKYSTRSQTSHLSFTWYQILHSCFCQIIHHHFQMVKSCRSKPVK